MLSFSTKIRLIEISFAQLMIHETISKPPQSAIEIRKYLHSSTDEVRHEHGRWSARGHLLQLFWRTTCWSDYPKKSRTMNTASASPRPACVNSAHTATRCWCSAALAPTSV